METTMILSLVCLLIGVCGFCIAVWSIYNTCKRQGNKGTVKIGHMKLQDNLCWKLDLEDKDTRSAVLDRMQIINLALLRLLKLSPLVEHTLPITLNTVILVQVRKM